MCSRIQETVAPAYQYILYNKDSALEMMLAVKTQFKPTTIATTRLIVREWNALLGVQKSSVDIAVWLTKVESKYNEARIFKVAEITPDGATYSFLDAVSVILSEFASQWDVKIAVGETIDFSELLTQYRTYLQNTSTRVARGHNRVGAFGATLQGLDADGNSPSTSNP